MADEPNQPPNPPEQEEEGTLPAGPRGGLRRGLGLLPQFPSSPRPRPASPRPDAGPGFDPSQATTGSSTASTEDPFAGGIPPKDIQEPPTRPLTQAELKDFADAIRQGVDIGFVWVGHGMGQLEKRAKGLPTVDEKWVPTESERAFVSEPAGRIARRHVHADHTALDTIDGLLIAIGIGAFGTRNALNIDPLNPGRKENMP